LADDGHEVVVVDVLLPAAHRVPPEDRRRDVERHAIDLVDEQALAAAVVGADAVCHQAAMVGLGVDFADVVEYCRHNDLGTAALLRVLHQTGFDGRIVLASSMVVYGEGRYRCPVHGLVRPGPRSPQRIADALFEPPCPACGADLSAEAVPEDAPLDPRNVYAATKLHQEHLCQAFAVAHPGVAVTALRYHNVYGPRMPKDTPYAGVASLFRSAVERGEAPQVLEDGGQRRDFVHVDDVARANVLALTAPEPATGPFNVCSGRPRTVLDLAEALVAADGSASPPEVVGGARPGDVRHVFASPERARDVLGFEAEVPFEQGVADFADAPLRA
ncbi:NAD-dependent dehydratase, partial [cyanobacterium TDX16]